MEKSIIEYKGTLIHQHAEMVSLTDMWRAAGSEPRNKPAEWYRTDMGRAFIAFVADNLKSGETHLWQTRLGRNGGTWAHWQIAMAYAKFLSPQFHMWANTVIRERMEGGANRAPELDLRQPEALPPPTFDSNAVTKSDLKVLCEWIGARLKQHEEKQRVSLLAELKALAAEIWHAKSSLRKDLTDPQRLADRGLLMLPAPTPETTYITATEICWGVIPEEELHKDLPGIVGKRILSHARRHQWPQGETPIRSRRDRPMPTYPVSRVQEWLDSGGADFIRDENARRSMASAENAGAIPFVRSQK